MARREAVAHLAPARQRPRASLEIQEARHARSAVPLAAARKGERVG
jgi:hypothetical protein